MATTIDHRPMNPNTDTPFNVFKGLFYSLGGAILLSTTWVIGKYAMDGFNVETFVVVWMSSAAAGALVIIVVTGQTARLALPGNAVSGILLLGLATGAGMITGWAGLKRLDPSFSAFIWRLLPVLGILFGVIFLREKMTTLELLPMAVMFVGGCLGTIGRWHIVGTGVVLTLFACCASAVQLLIAKIKVTQVHPTIMVFYRNGIAAVLMGAWMILTGKAELHVDWSYWLATILGAFIGPCAGFILTFRSYHYWELSRASMVMTMQPLFVLPLAYLFLDKLPDPKELLGGSIILVGAFWLAYIHLRKKNKGHIAASG